MDGLQAAIDFVQGGHAGRFERQRFSLDEAHAGFGARGEGDVLVGVLGAELGAEEFLVLLFLEDGETEIVGNGGDGEEGRANVAIDAAHPAGEFRIRTAALEGAVAAHQFDFVDEQHPTAVARGEEEAGGEAEALQGEFFGLDRFEREEAGTADLFEALADAADGDGFAGPEVGDVVDEFGIVAEAFVEEDGGFEKIA